MQGVTCNLANGMRVLRMNWLARKDRACSFSRWRIVSATTTTAGRAAAWTMRTCTLQRSYAGRCRPADTATPRSRDQGSARPGAAPRLGLAVHASTLFRSIQWMLCEPEDGPAVYSTKGGDGFRYEVHVHVSAGLQKRSGSRRYVCGTTKSPQIITEENEGGKNRGMQALQMPLVVPPQVLATRLMSVYGWHAAARSRTCTRHTHDTYTDDGPMH